MFKHFSQKTPFHIRVFVDKLQAAKGEIYWDDGDSLDTYNKGAFTHVLFEATKGNLRSIVKKNSSKIAMPNLDKISIFGLDVSAVKTVVLNGKSAKFNFEAKNKVIFFSVKLFSINKTLFNTWLFSQILEIGPITQDMQSGFSIKWA